MPAYYIAPDGSDSNDGSKNSPWFTIQHASSQVSPGDTIVALGGTYNYGTSNQVLQNSGSSGNRITLRAADSASPEFVWSGNKSNPQGWASGTTPEGIAIEVDYWNIEGIKCRDSESWGIQIRNNAQHITIRDCEVYDVAGPGIGIAHDGDYVLFKNCSAHHCGVQGETTGDGDGFIGNADGAVYQDVVYDNCDAYSNTDDGIDCLDSRGAVIRYCRGWDNGRTGSSTDGSGMGIKTGGGQNDSGEHLIHHCAAWSNEADGITDNLAHRGNEFYNCTAWNNGAADFRFTDRNFIDSNQEHVVRNCLIYENDGGEAVIQSAVDHQNNSWNLGITEPQFVSTNPGDSGFLRLSSNSPCIDQGVDLGYSYDGNAPDLGAYEYAETSTQPKGKIKVYDGSSWNEITDISMIQG